jgi:Undecaprenyl-phosphate glucose phosphotransferase
MVMWLFVFNISWFIIAVLFKLYSFRSINNVEGLFRSPWKVTLLHIVLITLLFFIGGNLMTVKLISLSICYITVIAGLIASRCFITYIIEFVINKGNLKKKTAIIGFDTKAKALGSYFSNPKSIYAFQGYFSDNRYVSFIDKNGNILAPIERSIDYALENGIQEIYSTLPDKDSSINKILEIAENNCIRIKFIDKDVFVTKGNPLPHCMMDQCKVLNIRKEPLENLNNKIKKRAFDIVVSLFVIAFILTWLIPLVAILIKLESKGPVFFIQKRSGRNNQVFRCIKFRSMHMSEDCDIKQASRNDSRIMGIGAFLRRNNIDEMPQFLNVLIGSMSVIGPRPHMLAHTAQYSKIVSSFMVRHLITPGISGWAQVNGLRGEIEEPILMEKRVSHDIWYLENWSLMLDIKIVFMTIVNIFKGDDKAY